MIYDNSQVIIDLDAIRENICAVRERAGVDVMAVIKADAYGHGAIPLARLLEKECAFFGVSSITEALELRNAGITNPILILGQISPAGYPDAVKNKIRPVLFKMEDAVAFSEAALAEGCEAPFHFAVDTGMSRIGFQVSEASADICAQIASLPNIKAEGLFSHFATADCLDLTRAKKQAELYAAFDEMLRARGVVIPIRHLNNSAGVMNFSTPYEMVRSGIVTYGLYPSDEVDYSLLKLRPALSWISRISHIKWLEAGREIGYGGTYTTKEKTLVATIPVGYADGYRRNLSNKFYVLIRGQKAPILGRICMDQMMVDVTDIPDISPEDTVVLVGKSGDEEITVETIAAECDSFNYEFVCGISRRVPRVYCKNGKEVQIVHYLIDEHGGSL